MFDYDLIVIGAGPGGSAAAGRALSYGMKTAVIEKGEIGGTCLNRGCIPTKSLIHASDVYKNAVRQNGFGVKASAEKPDMRQMYAWRREISATLSSGMEKALIKAKADIVRGTARITASNTIEVEKEDGSRTVLTAANILLATGSEPFCPPIPGLDCEGVMTSNELLGSEGQYYESVIIIGGGVVGVEFAVFFMNLGTKVTLIEGAGNLLPNMDRELGTNLAQIIKKEGHEVLVNCPVQKIEKLGESLAVSYDSKGETKTVCAEKVLVAIGRKAYFENLFAEGIQPELNGRSIKVNENYETSLPGVYAIGDVSSKIQLAHVADAQGKAVADYLAGKKNAVCMNQVPSIIYCEPEIASIGLSDKEAKEAGINIITGKAVMGANARTLISGAGRSFMKVVAEAESHKILGAQLMCPNASDMISELTTAVVNGLTAEELLTVMRPHPSFEEALNDALNGIVKKL